MNDSTSLGSITTTVVRLNAEGRKIDPDILTHIKSSAIVCFMGELEKLVSGKAITDLDDRINDAITRRTTGKPTEWLNEMACAVLLTQVLGVDSGEVAKNNVTSAILIAFTFEKMKESDLPSKALRTLINAVGEAQVATGSYGENTRALDVASGGLVEGYPKELFDSIIRTSTTFYSVIGLCPKGDELITMAKTQTYLLRRTFSRPDKYKARQFELAAIYVLKNRFGVSDEVIIEKSSSMMPLLIEAYLHMVESNEFKAIMLHNGSKLDEITRMRKEIRETLDHCTSLLVNAKTSSH